MEVSTPTNLRDKYSKEDEARGGPWVASRLQGTPSRDLNQDFVSTMDEFSQTQIAVKT